MWSREWAPGSFGSRICSSLARILAVLFCKMGTIVEWCGCVTLCLLCPLEDCTCWPSCGWVGPHDQLWPMTAGRSDTCYFQVGIVNDLNPIFPFLCLGQSVHRWGLPQPGSLSTDSRESREQSPITNVYIVSKNKSYFDFSQSH